MAKILRPNKVVVVLNGRYAGKKAVIVKNMYRLHSSNSPVRVDEGTKDKPYGHCIIVGIEKEPLRVTKSMSAKKIQKRSRVKPFMKVVNFNHVMPTRYSVDLDLKALVTQETLKDPAKKKEARKELKKLLEERYNSGQNKWFFQKLRF